MMIAALGTVEMNPGYTGLLEVAYNWQSLIAGVLAFTAGVFAYLVGRKQAEGLREQNRFLVREKKRDLARRSFVAATMLLAVLDTIAASLIPARNNAKAPSNPQMPHIVDQRILDLVRKPQLAIVWNDVAVCGSEVASKYLQMHFRLEQLITSGTRDAPTVTAAISEIDNLIAFLKHELDQGLKRVNTLLAETEEV